ncbi:MAG: hypothetical protein L6R38_002939 [Xanthoria sp. 2 TBL-2021]|nr:MAG: hypothetical protein L6R38_002939 [Xanthoria sp. 2 TBL-2021]
MRPSDLYTITLLGMATLARSVLTETGSAESSSLVFAREAKTAPYHKHPARQNFQIRDSLPVKSYRSISQETASVPVHDRSITRRQYGRYIWQVEVPFELAVLTAFAVYAYVAMLDKLLKWDLQRTADNPDLLPSASYSIGDFTYRWGCNFAPIPRELLESYVKKKKNVAEKGFVPLTETEWWSRADGRKCWIKQTLTPRDKKKNRKTQPGDPAVPHG